jgi:hypothetical protein
MHDDIIIPTQAELNFNTQKKEKKNYLKFRK